MTESERAGLRLKVYRAFSPHAPIDRRTVFAGRSDQILRLLRVLAQKGQHAIIYGERGVGKTSLVTVLREFLTEEDYPAEIIRINCDNTDTFTRLWKKLFAEATFTEHVPKTGFREGTSDHQNSLLDMIPDTATPDDIRRLLTLERAGRATVVVLDEFDRLSNIEARAQVADTIKALSDFASQSTIIIVGVAHSVEDLLADHLSIGRNIVQIPMPRMSLLESEEILTKALPQTGLSITSAAKTRIARLARGIPYYTHLLGQFAALETIDHDSTEITESHVFGGAIEAQQDIQLSTKQAYNHATLSKRTNAYPHVVLACALVQKDELGYFSASDIQSALSIVSGRARGVSDYLKILDRLTESQRGPLLQKSGEKRHYAYRFVDSLMEPFIIMEGFRDGTLTDELLQRLVPAE